MKRDVIQHSGITDTNKDRRKDRDKQRQTHRHRHKQNTATNKNKNKLVPISCKGAHRLSLFCTFYIIS